MTQFSSVYDAFFNKMELDPYFFDYFNLTEEENMEIAKERASVYLMEAIAVILRRCEPDATINFEDYDVESECFADDLKVDEIDMLASLMYEQEFRRQVSRLKAFHLQHLPSTLNVFSPANERKTIQSMLQSIHEDNLTLLDNYSAKDRTTRKSRVIDYDSYSEELGGEV